MAKKSYIQTPILNLLKKWYDDGTAKQQPKIQNPQQPIPNNFLDWYKANKGKDYDHNIGNDIDYGSLSPKNADVGQALYNQFLVEQNLVNNKNNQLEALGKQKTASQEDASILYDRMMKYLPQEMINRGIGNSGVSETAMIEAQNNYANRLADISQGYDLGMSQVKDKYSSDMLNAQLYGQQNLNNILAQYRPQEQADRESTKMNVMDKVAELTKKKDKNGYSSAIELIEQYRHLFGDNEYDFIIKDITEKRDKAKK